MKFGIHNPSWLFGPDPGEIFEAVKGKALWAENHGYTGDGSPGPDRQCRRAG